ncbi:MAG TPA: TonB-dependent receptor [Steroidobacteraceae bacterium]|jgi:iron complex outermembrane receptor protein|nr:TonB-dependent receptor [Steroidobacteraceae bacterium]
MATQRSRIASLGVLCTLASMLTVDVMAAETGTLEEVVVTARKRDEAFRDVPVTINVFTDKSIQAAGIERPSDYVHMVPNMNLVETQNAGNAFVVIRGISQARNSEPSVAVLVDGVAQTNPAQFNQELYDVTQIEVLKGPQGGLYGRNAIGGAILYTTRPPADEFEGSVKLGYGNESSYRAQGTVSGPITDTLKFRLAGSYYNTDGFLENEFLDQKADPVRDLAGRVRLLWTPNEMFTGDLRVAYDQLQTRALYFVIPRADEANPFSIVQDANNTSTPITLDNPGINDRDLWNAALKMDFKIGEGTLTSISSYDDTEEILTGDAFDFRPAPVSFFQTLIGVDLNQSQWLSLQSYSQELRYVSPTSGRIRWIAGAYYVHTDRFISTGNMVDTGAGVFPVHEDPRLSGPNPNATFLSDSQKQDAWALFADVTFEVTDKFEIDAALRYDEDRRENTTETPQAFIPQPDPMNPTVFTGDVRTHTWSEPQPKITLRYKPVDNVTLYGGYSRGFRSGGFNQTGVGVVADQNGIAGVNDLFNAEVADTYEIGMKGQFMDRRLDFGAALFYTQSTNGYFFVFLAANSTQNLGNLDADYKGGELEMTAHLTDRFDVYASYGYTDSKITDMEDPTVKGNEAPLVSRYTANAGFQYRQPLSAGLDLTFRADYRKIGETWWEPYNVTSRDPIDLLDARIGLGSDKWTVTAWSKNLTDEEYNQEFSPGGFLFKALPRQYGLEFTYKF